MKNLVKVVIDGAVIKGESEPLMIYENNDQARAVPDD